MLQVVAVVFFCYFQTNQLICAWLSITRCKTYTCHACVRILIGFLIYWKIVEMTVLSLRKHAYVTNSNISRLYKR